MKKVFSFVIVSIVSFISFGQGEFKFEEESFNFGTVIEGEQAQHVFKFKNTGNEPIIINQVKASCGCTTPSWTRTPVAPGETGEIRAKYNSKGRPGSFHKSITITSNAKTPTKVLRINGVVERAPAKVYTPEEIAASPHIKFTKSEYNFGNIQYGSSVSKKFEITNTGKTDLTIRNLKSPCNCVKYSLSNSPLKPGEKGTITVVYKPRAKGSQNELVSVYTNDVTKSNEKIILKGNVVENASNKSIIDSDNKITF